MGVEMNEQGGLTEAVASGVRRQQPVHAGISP